MQKIVENRHAERALCGRKGFLWLKGFFVAEIVLCGRKGFVWQ